MVDIKKVEKKGMMTYILLGAGILLVGFLCLLFYVLKTKSVKVNHLPPFQSAISENLKLEKEVLIFQDLDPVNKKYPYLMIEHSDSAIAEIQYRLNEKPATLLLVDSLPKASMVHFQNAIVYTNGVSGSSQPYLFGLVNDRGNGYSVAYQWGVNKPEKWMYGDKSSWQFPMAPWQNKPDTAYYSLPKGWW